MKFQVIAVGALGLALAAGCGGDGSDSSSKPKTNTTTAALLSPQRLSDALGSIVGSCSVASEFGGLPDAESRAKVRKELQLLIDTARANPNAPTADAGYTVRDALFDAAGEMKGCGPGLELEAEKAIDSLP